MTLIATAFLRYWTIFALFGGFGIFLWWISGARSGEKENKNKGTKEQLLEGANYRNRILSDRLYEARIQKLELIKERDEAKKELIKCQEELGVSKKENSMLRRLYLSKDLPSNLREQEGIYLSLGKALHLLMQNEIPDSGRTSIELSDDFLHRDCVGHYNGIPVYVIKEVNDSHGLCQTSNP